MRPATPRVSRLQVTPSGLAALTIKWHRQGLGDHTGRLPPGLRGQPRHATLRPCTRRARAGSRVYRSAARRVHLSRWAVDRIRGRHRRVEESGGDPGPGGHARHGRFRGGAIWGPNDTIIVATSNLTGLQRVAPAGGPPTVLTPPDRAQGEADHFWPELLPGGRAVLFTITAATGGLDAAQVAVVDLQTGKRRVLVRGGHHAHYVPTGHLMYAVAGTLRAVPFDLARLETRGTAVPVVSDVVTTSLGLKRMREQVPALEVPLGVHRAFFRLRP